MRPSTFSDDDLTARARIRDAAMHLFASQGSAASVRAIAAEARVSPALVTHHFGTKEGLRQAVDDSAIRIFKERTAGLPETGSPEELAQVMGEAVGDVISHHPTLRAYLRRSFLEGTEASQALFDDLFELVRHGLDILEAGGGVRPDSDAEWRPLQVLFVIIGPLLLEPVLGSHVDGGVFDAAVVARRQTANLDFVTRGVLATTARKRRSR